MKTDTLGILMDGRRQENLNTQSTTLKKITLTNLSGAVVLFEVEIPLFQFIDTTECHEE